MPEPFFSPENLPSNGLGRRRFLELAALASAGLALTTSPAHAFLGGLFGKPSRAEILSKYNLPEAWLKILGPTMTDYADFLGKLKLRRISVRQIIEPHTKKRGEVQNQIPPKALWKNIRATLIVTDKVAAAVGEPVAELISVYRSPAYNARCPGARPSSQHLRNTAVDIKFRSADPRHVSNAARVLRMEGHFKGGVGRYSSFTHIDTRGSNADW